MLAFFVGFLWCQANAENAASKRDTERDEEREREREVEWEVECVLVMQY